MGKAKRKNRRRKRIAGERDKGMKKQYETTMTLQERRDQWEEGGIEEQCVVANDDGYKTVLVIASYPTQDMIIRKYQLLRYFTIGGSWEVSCDVSQEGEAGLTACMEWITNFCKNLYPKGE